ncbi:MAG: hypothetical protein QGH15_09580 [Kiritimatiellia bacterium]|jgi:hypothetical protein|nr:hypothetical protein [Kiritimatiellia bacterium]
MVQSEIEDFTWPSRRVGRGLGKANSYWPYRELAPAEDMIERYPGYGIWDRSLVWTTAVEYVSRSVEIPQLTLPNTGAPINLYDLRSNLIDSVTYGIGAPWPMAAPSSLELIDPDSDNSAATSWQICNVVGTPGTINSVTLDTDGDGMADPWEESIVTASGGALSDITDVLPGDDFDGDGFSNLEEYVAGLDPTVDDADLLRIEIDSVLGKIQVSFDTIQPTGTAYTITHDRLYNLLSFSSNRIDYLTWFPVDDYTNLPATGSSVIFTNDVLKTTYLTLPETLSLSNARHLTYLMEQG